MKRRFHLLLEPALEASSRLSGPQLAKHRDGHRNVKEILWLESRRVSNAALTVVAQSSHRGATVVPSFPLADPFRAIMPCLHRNPSVAIVP